MPTDIPSSIPFLVARWDPPYDLNVDGVLQYRVSNPQSDGIEGVHVTFIDGVPTAVAGLHESPDVTITLTFEDYLLVSVDELELLKAFMTKKASMVKHNSHGILLVRHLGKSYRKRP